jgi:hypothetical protein
MLAEVKRNTQLRASNRVARSFFAFLEKLRERSISSLDLSTLFFQLRLIQSSSAPTSIKSPHYSHLNVKRTNEFLAIWRILLNALLGIEPNNGNEGSNLLCLNTVYFD